MVEPGVHQILFYSYVEDILDRRGPYREAHLAHIRAGREAGRVAIAGPLGDPPHGAAIVFKGDDPGPVEAFAQADPYLQAGLVTSWRIDVWNVV